MLFFFAPTYVVNVAIFLKEMTMNQYAWSAEEDYPEGYLLNGLVNLDVLYWLGISEDKSYYLEEIKEWSREFL